MILQVGGLCPEEPDFSQQGWSSTLVDNVVAGLVIFHAP